MEIELQPETDIDKFQEIIEFIDHFNIHYRLLLRRFERFMEINQVYNADIDLITYIDMIVVQLRAMCIEWPNKGKNYTVQNFLRKTGKNELALRIEKMLDEPFIPDSNLSIKQAIKMLADKFICHYDNFDMERKMDFALAETVLKLLRNPFYKPNLEYIVTTIIDCVGNGLTLKLK